MALGLFPIIWTQGRLLAGFDIPIFPNMREYLSHSFFLWDDRLYLGNPSASIGLIFPVQVPWAIFESIGISMANRTTIMLCAMFAATGMGMYYFISVMDPTRQQLSRLAAAVFYMFNLFSLQFFSWQQYSLIMAYIVLPVCLGLYKAAYEQHRYRNLAVIAILSLFITPQYTPSFILFWGVIFAYTCYVLVLGPGSRIFIVKFFVFSGLLAIAVSVPFLIALSSLTVVPITAWAERSKASVDFYMSQASTINIFRLMGFYTWGQENVVPHYSFGEIYFQSPIMIFLTFLVPLGVFGAMLIDKRPPKDIKFFLWYLPLSLLLTTGPSGPFGQRFYEWIHNTIPGFTSIFGQATTKIPLLTTLSYAVLLAYLISQATKCLAKGKSH